MTAPGLGSGGFGSGLMRRKSVELLVAEGCQGEGGELWRSLGTRIVWSRPRPCIASSSFPKPITVRPSALDRLTWMVFGVWRAIGLVLYFAYGMSRSRLATAEK